MKLSVPYMREVRIRPRAQLDIESLFIHIAFELNDRKAAFDTVEAIYGALERIAEFPETGRLFEDADLGRDYRRVLVRSYWAYFTCDEEAVTVWRIFHERRDIDNCTVVDL